MVCHLNYQRLQVFSLSSSLMGKAAVVQVKTISYMIASMELRRPRITPVLPQWDLGIVVEALSKPPYEPLREASLKHLTLKTCLPHSYGFSRKTQ